MKLAVDSLVRRLNHPDSDTVESLDAWNLDLDRLRIFLVASGDFDRINQHERPARVNRFAADRRRDFVIG